MTTKPTFRDKLRKVRPEIAEDAAKNKAKRELALALKALRKEKGLTQKQVEARSGLSQPVLSRLEAPSGALPNWETVTRYVEACGGHMIVGIAGHTLDASAFTAKAGEASDDIFTAVAV